MEEEPPEDQEIDKGEEPEETAQPGVPPVTETQADAGRGFWSGFLLVAGGALLGALVMLLVLLAYSGTLSYASRSEVDALNRNLDTMYQNSEVAWERLDRLSADNADLTAKVDRLMQLSGRIAQLEQDMSDVRGDLGTVEDGIASVESDLATLRDTYDSRFDEMDASLAAQADLLDRLEGDLAQVRETVGGMEERLASYDGFFDALRDLLLDLQGAPTDNTESQAEADQAPTPTETEDTTEDASET